MRFAPTGLGIHVTRARIAGKWRKPITELAPIIAAAAGALFDASPDLIVYHCTDSSMREGLDGERRILEIVRRETGIEAVSTSAMVVEALNALGIKKLVVVSPYRDNDVIIAYLQSCGFTVIHDVALNLPGHASSGAPPEHWVESTLNNARDETEGYFVSCTKLPRSKPSRTWRWRSANRSSAATRRCCGGGEAPAIAAWPDSDAAARAADAAVSGVYRGGAWLPLRNPACPPVAPSRAFRQARYI
jgi:maleate cis-trans isomerase